MEFQVRHVGSLESCFLSLPLHLIQTLESTRPAFSSQVLTLELRSSATGHHWTVAWSGAASSSSAIEVSPQFAECISLPEHISVQVKVVSNVANATLVTVEPHTEDDWEVLELNAEQAEGAILKQVRIVHEGMRFPLWLHGRTIITFHVVSTFPKKAVVQLVSGTEVAVAPKRRKKDIRKQEELMKSSNKVQNVPKALLRLQDPSRKLFRECDVKGLEVSVELTSVGYVHPKTAKKFSLDSLQLVTIVPRVPSKQSPKTSSGDGQRMKSSSAPREDKKEFRQATIRLLFSESMAEGHLMVARSLCLYLRAGMHSWIYLKGCNTDLKEGITSLSLSPCFFQTLGQNKETDKNGLEVVDSNKSQKPTYMFAKGAPDSSVDVVDSADDIFSAVTPDFPLKGDEEATHESDNRNGLKRLFITWFLKQLDVITPSSGLAVDSLILGAETLLSFEVKGYDSEDGKKTKLQASLDSNATIKSNSISSKAPRRFLYVLTINEESLHKTATNAYKLVLDEREKDNLGTAALFGKLKLGDPISFYTIKERISTKGFNSNVSSLSWMGTNASDVINRIMVLLSPASSMLLSKYNVPLPGHVLIYGPHGSGKTILARAVAKSLEEDEDLLAHIVFVSCSEISLEKASTIRQSLSSYIAEALDYAPSLVILDDLDSLISSSSDSEGSQASTSVVALTKFLSDIMDEYGDKRMSSCGIGPLAFIATVKTLESIPQSLSSSGRFDFHAQLPAPGASERKAILKHEIKRRSIHCSDDILLDVASKCDGYDAYDLETLVDRTVHAAIGRFLPSYSNFGKGIPTLTMDDFSRAMHGFLPVVMRDITKSSAEGGRAGWDDVGGLKDVRNSIEEMIEFPSKFPNIFSQSPLRLRSNVLLYGPPGCGKTHIVGAAAAACSLRFISVKGPELLNKYIGASEQAVRDIFSKAAAASPCLLFFDEFDSIAPKRGHDNTGVTDRVVNQFLTELDGVEVLTGVFVFAATSRPDLLDAALLRPGRLDRLLFCDFPSPTERLDILSVLSKKLPLANDVDLDYAAYMTEGFSGADLQALLSDAQLAAVHEILDSGEGKEPGRKPIITDVLLKSIASKARPSISDTEKQRLYGIYSQFLDAKRSVAAQSKDAKGKRATLA